MLTEVDTVLELNLDPLLGVPRRQGGRLHWHWRIHESQQLLAELLTEDGPANEHVLCSDKCTIEVESPYAADKTYDDSDEDDNESWWDS